MTTGTAAQAREALQAWSGYVDAPDELIDAFEAAIRAEVDYASNAMLAAAYERWRAESAETLRALREAVESALLVDNEIILRQRLRAALAATSAELDMLRVIELALASCEPREGDVPVDPGELLRNIEEGGYTLRLTTSDERRARNDRGMSR